MYKNGYLLNSFNPHTFRALLFILIYFFMSAISSNALPTNADSFQIEFQEGYLVFTAQKAPLKIIIDGIAREFQVAITGLDARYAEALTFSIKAESLQEVLKLMFRHLGEKNVAFEFIDNRLRYISVVPESKKKLRSQPQMKGLEAVPEDRVTAIEVLEVMNASQAVDIGVEKGDLILEYGGMRLSRASELVEETKRRSPSEIVEMVVFRKGGQLRFYVYGGFIGVRVKTVTVLKEWVDY